MLWHLIIIEPAHAKPKKWLARQAKTQISLRSHTVWSESSLGAVWLANDQIFFLHVAKTDWADAQADLSLAVLLVLSRGGANGIFLRLLPVIWKSVTSYTSLTRIATTYAGNLKGSVRNNEHYESRYQVCCLHVLVSSRFNSCSLNMFIYLY